MDAPFLRQALDEARLRRGFCAPNPSVGAVIVKNGEVIARGHHIAPGKAHAEVMALEQAGTRARGSTVYVTLEPCCHWGRTPPCTDALIEQGVSRVVYGYRDANPQVHGKGASRLREMGIDCSWSQHPEIESFYESYEYWTARRVPWVTAKLALSLDGKIAGSGGQRIAITGEILNRSSHERRLHSDAILTSAKTIVQDDPLLNVRLADPAVSKPVYVLDRKAKLPLTARIWESAQSLTVFCSESADKDKQRALADKGARVIHIDAPNDKLDLKQVLVKIGKDGRHDLWIEAGGVIFLAMAQLGLVNKALVYVAPNWIGTEGQLAFTNDAKDIFSRASHISWDSAGRDAICEIRW